MPKKFDDCIAQVKAKQKGKVNAYAVCNASMKKTDGEKCMSEVKKALTAGYSEGGTAPEKIEEVYTGAPATPVAKPEEKAPEAVAVAPAAPETKVETAAAPAAETKPQEKKAVIPAGLFKPFTLGSVIQPNPNGGSSLSGMKKPAMDYVGVEKKATKNVVMTAEDFKPKK